MFNDEKYNHSKHYENVSCNNNTGTGRICLQLGESNGQDHSSKDTNETNDIVNNILGSDIAKDEKSMKNISNYLLNQSLKRKRQENDVLFKGGKFGQKKLLKQQRLEKIAKLRKQQITKMRLLNRVGKINNGRANDASHGPSGNNANEENKNDDNGNDGNNNGDENLNENKENGDVDMLVDPVVSNFLQDFDVNNDNENDNENENENETKNENNMANINNNENVINSDINVNNNGQLMQSGDKKNQDSDSYFCINCHMYVDDRGAHNAIYHSKSE